MSPDQWSQCGVVTWCHGILPSLLGQDLLDHQGVDVDHTILNQMQGKHADLMIVEVFYNRVQAALEQ